MAGATMRTCTRCGTSSRERSARWCPHCGGPLATTGRASSPGTRARLPGTPLVRATLVAILGAAGIAGLLAGGDGLPAGGLGSPAPGGGEIELVDTEAREPAGAEGDDGPAEPGSLGLSLDDPPPDAPWLTDDGSPWTGDLTLDPFPVGPTPPTSLVGQPTALPDASGWQLEMETTPVDVEVIDDRVVVATRGGRIASLSLADGSMAWQLSLTFPVSTLAGAGGDTLVVANASRTVTMLAAETGAALWSQGLPGDILGIDGLGPAGGDTAGGSILVAARRADDHLLVALDPADGTPRWERAFSGSWLADEQGRVAGATVVDGDRLIGLDPADGGEDWSVELGPDERLLTAVADLAMLRGSGSYRWVDLATGQVPFYSGSVLGSWLDLGGGTIVLASGGSPPILIATSPTGEERWRGQTAPRPGGAGCCLDLLPAPGGDLIVADRRGEALVSLRSGGDGTELRDLSDLEDGTGREVLAVTSDAAVVASGSGSLGVDLRTGRPAWRLPGEASLLRAEPLLLTLSTDPGSEAVTLVHVAQSRGTAG